MENEIGLRIGFFFGVLIIIALWECLRPKLKLRISRNIRWFRNLSLIVLNSIAARLILPFTAASIAIYAEKNQIGLLNFLSIPLWLTVIVSIVLLDLIIYAQHLASHHFLIFWRLHKIHHIDQDIDVTTGVRFHPVEIIISTLIKCAVVMLLGIPFIAIVMFEIILNATSMFNHGNINLPEKFDEWLRLIIVTPDMHRIHHSIIPTETNSNFGFNLPWWDRLFGTYQSQPQKGHQKMEIGLSEYQDINKTNLLTLIIIPFNKKK